MSIIAISVTTIECDGQDAAPCPNGAVVEFPHPQSAAIRLAKQSGWTVWMEATCPECVAADAIRTVRAPVVPAMKTATQAPDEHLVLVRAGR